MEALKPELDRFLSSPEANYGIATANGQDLISRIPIEDDEAYKYFVDILLPSSNSNVDGSNFDEQEHAAKSYRAMTVLKQDLSQSGLSPSIIKGPTQAGLLAKDLLAGLAGVAGPQRYSTYHIRELLDALLEAFPEKTMAAAAAGGKQGVQDHLGPLLESDQTLSILTHLVCIGATGRKGIASAEKSAQHTAMYQHTHNDPRSKISTGLRRKFVKAMSDFELMDKLARSLASTTAEEELCETILTILEVVGYPPDDPALAQQQQKEEKEQKKNEMVGEDTLLSPLGKSEWWGDLFRTIQRNDCTYERREAIARTCNHAFSLATGNSSRICKSHAPATDATEQTSEKIVEQKEEQVKNRLIEWGLTDKMHAALISQLPLLVEVLDLPSENVLNHQATEDVFAGSRESVTQNDSIVFIRHPGRYQTNPLGSWRLQLLSLLKEVITYRVSEGDSKLPTKTSNPYTLAMDALMELPVPPEILKAKTGKQRHEGEGLLATSPTKIYNPWPALCSFVWAYPNNDFYHIIFFQMLQSIVLEHHEPTLRLILQKSKFLTKAVNSLQSKALQGTMINCLNLLSLKSKSLPPSAFLHQYLGSHDGWKATMDVLNDLTLKQQMPIMNEKNMEIDLSLGSPFATKLGLVDVGEWDATTASTVSDSSSEEAVRAQINSNDKGAGRKKKKKKKKK